MDGVIHREEIESIASQDEKRAVRLSHAPLFLYVLNAILRLADLQ